MLSAFRSQDVVIQRSDIIYESRKVVKRQSTKINQINSKNHNVFASRNWILPNRTMLISVCFIP